MSRWLPRHGGSTARLAGYKVMSFDREPWLATFTERSIPPWPCPVCRDGKLALEKDTLLTRESAESKKDRENYPEHWEPHWVYGHFIALFQCTRADCLSSVTVCGDYRVEHEYAEDGQDLYEEICTPTYFNPALPMLRLPRGCTDAVARELTKAWGFYWSDPSSAANHIRTGVERLMDHLAVSPKSKLDRRITAYQEAQPELGGHLMAIKWLGNAGSHGVEPTARETARKAWSEGKREGARDCRCALSEESRVGPYGVIEQSPCPGTGSPRFLLGASGGTG